MILVDPEHARGLQALGEHVVVGPRRRHEAHLALPQPAHRAEDVLDPQGRVLDAVAPLVLVKEVDLRAPKEGPKGLVIGELRARGRIPHHRRAQPRAGLPRGIDIDSVKLDPPVLARSPSRAPSRAGPGFIVSKFEVM